MVHGSCSATYVNLADEAVLCMLESGRPINLGVAQGFAVAQAPVVARALPSESATSSDLRVARAVPVPIVEAGGGGGVEQGNGGAAGGFGPLRARKTKRMERRLSHWQCTYCRHETALAAHE